MTFHAAAAFRVGDALKFHKGDFVSAIASANVGKRKQQALNDVIKQSCRAIVNGEKTSLSEKRGKKAVDTDRVTVSTALISRCSHYDGHSQQRHEDVQQ